MDRLVSAVSGTLKKAGLWRSDAVLLAAVSGGPDSLALLYALVLAAKEAGFSLEACHIQHRLRPESAQLDQALTQRLCEKWKVSLTVLEAGLEGSMEAPGIETLARERRRALFAQRMAEIGADGLLLGHHLNDQAETVLMRLCRGAGLHGLSGMQEIAPFGRGVMVRPFLHLEKQALVQALEEADVPWRTDESNRLPLTPRNALRLEALPALEVLFPGAARHMAQCAESLGEDEACLQGLAQTLFNAALYRSAPIFALRLAPLTRTPKALAMRVLRCFYQEGLRVLGITPDELALGYEESQAFWRLLGSAPGQTFNLPCGLEALRGKNHLHLLKQGGEALAPTPAPKGIALAPREGQYTLNQLRVRLTPPQATLYPTPEDAWRILAPEAWLSHLVLRWPQPGDVFFPFGAPGSKPLRRYLTDQKLDPPFRQCLPLLAMEGRVLWIPGLATSEELRVKQTPGLWQAAVEDRTVIEFAREKE